MTVDKRFERPADAIARAKELGHLIGKSGKSLIYGGMDAGLMGILAQNALDSSAYVTGIIPKKIKDSERILSGLSETVLVADLTSELFGTGGDGHRR